MRKDKAHVSQSLMAMDALRKILEVTEITGLAYDPNYQWVLAVEQRDAEGEPREWTGSRLEHVLRNAADDLAKPMEAVLGAARAQPCVRCGSLNTRPPSASDESFETIPICADCGCGT